MTFNYICTFVLSIMVKNININNKLNRVNHAYYNSDYNLSILFFLDYGYSFLCLYERNRGNEI